MSESQSPVVPIVKGASAIAAAGGAMQVAAAEPAHGLMVMGLGVGDWASIAAFSYSAYLIGEVVWKKLLRPLTERMGWLQRHARRSTDRSKGRQRGQAQPRVMVALLAVSAAGFVGYIAMPEGYTDRAIIPVPGDVPTNGFGSTGPDIKLGDKTTPPQALARALRDVGKSEGAIRGCVHVPLSQGEFDAYTAMVYNIGAAAFCGSTLVRKLNALDYAGACAEISRWDKFQGRSLAGLTIRRAKERQLCEGRA